MPQSFVRGSLPKHLVEGSDVITADRQTDDKTMIRFVAIPPIAIRSVKTMYAKFQWSGIIPTHIQNANMIFSDMFELSAGQNSEMRNIPNPQSLALALGLVAKRYLIYRS